MLESYIYYSSTLAKRTIQYKTNTINNIVNFYGLERNVENGSF